MSKMSKKKKTQMITLLAICGVMIAVLILVVVINNINTKKQEEADDLATPRLVQTDNVNEIELINNGTSIKFAKTETTGTDSSAESSTESESVWTYTADADFPLDDTTLTSIEGLVSDFKALSQPEKLDSLEAYGLENPAYSVTVNNDAGESYTILLGNETVDGDYYAMLESDPDTIYVIDSTLYGYVSKNLYDMAELGDYPAFSSDIMTNISISGSTGADFEVRPVEVEQAVDSDADSSTGSSSEVETEIVTEYHWFLNDADKTGESAVTELNTEVDSISFDSMAAFKPTQDELTQYGLLNPTAVVTVNYTENSENKTSVLTVGSLDSTGENYYCTLDTYPNDVYLVSADSVKDIIIVAENGYDYLVTSLAESDAEE